MRKYMDTNSCLERVMSYQLIDYFFDKDEMLKKSNKLMNKINDIVMKSDFDVVEGYMLKDKSMISFITCLDYGKDVPEGSETVVLDYSKYSDKLRIHTWGSPELGHLPEYNENDETLLDLMSREVKYGKFYYENIREDDEDIYERGYYCEIDNLSKKIDSLEDILTDVSKILKTYYGVLVDDPRIDDGSILGTLFDDDENEICNPDSIWENLKKSISDKSILKS